MRPRIQYFERNDGLTSAYQIFEGDKSRVPLVMVTGLSAIGTVDWGPDFDVALGRTRPVLVLDNRLVGKSTVKEEMLDDAYDFTLDDLADDVVKLIEHVGWKEIDLLGFSMGGMIVQILVLKPSLPFRVRKVVLSATSAKSPRSDLFKHIKQPAKHRSQMTPAELDEQVRPFMEANYSLAFINDPAKRARFEERVKGAWAHKRPLRTILAQSAAVAQYNVIDQLPSISKSMPVLIIHGADDKAVYFTERQRLLKGIKHAEIAKLPSEAYGHFWYDYFDPSTWSTLLSDWLDRDSKL